MPHRNRSKQNRRVDSNPTPAEIRAGRTAAGLEIEAAAKLIYSTRTSWEAWESDDPALQRRMHPAIWELFLFKTGQLHTHAEWAKRVAEQMGPGES